MAKVQTKEILVEKVKPAVERFLGERGLALSEEKTKITHIKEGFDFLGFNIRKYNKKLIITPSKTSVKSFLATIRAAIKSYNTAAQRNMIFQLNPKIRGWVNYYRHVCAKKTFHYVDYCIFQALWRWAKRRHPTKGMSWIKNKYFHSSDTRNWIFATPVKLKHGNMALLKLVEASLVPIIRHTKIKAEATPYHLEYADYLTKRTRKIK